MALGWIKLYRSLLNSQIWVTKEPYDKRSAWIYLLLKASHEDMVVEFKGETVNLKSGTLIDTYRHFSDTWMWPLARVQRYIEKLKAIQMINAERYKGGTLITIVNWEFYQGLDGITDTLSDTPTDTSFFENRYSILEEPIRSPIRKEKKKETKKEKKQKKEVKKKVKKGTPYKKIIYIVQRSMHQSLLRLKQRAFLKNFGRLIRRSEARAVFP